MKEGLLAKSYTKGSVISKDGTKMDLGKLAVVLVLLLCMEVGVLPNTL